MVFRFVVRHRNPYRISRSRTPGDERHTSRTSRGRDHTGVCLDSETVVLLSQYGDTIGAHHINTTCQQVVLQHSMLFVIVFPFFPPRCRRRNGPVPLRWGQTTETRLLENGPGRRSGKSETKTKPVTNGRQSMTVGMARRERELRRGGKIYEKSFWERTSKYYSGQQT